MDKSLVDRLFDACVASCTCAIKSPDIQYHLPECHYRLFTEARSEIIGLSSALQDSRREVSRLYSRASSENGQS